MYTGDICIQIAGSHCCITETYPTVKSKYTPIKNNYLKLNGISLQGHFAYLIVDTYFLVFYALAFIIYVLTLHTYIYFTVFG